MADGRAKARIRRFADEIKLEMIPSSIVYPMGVVIDNIEEIAMALPSESRARLAGRLIESLVADSESPELREARITELRRRVSEIKSGTAKFIDADTAFKRIDELLAR